MKKDVGRMPVQEAPRKLPIQTSEEMHYFDENVKILALGGLLG
ncbi:MAG: hypothetical protein ABSF48_25180 [Thermodesulfobacteriota bacterium]|jgi:hypothetical protein